MSVAEDRVRGVTGRQLDQHAVALVQQRLLHTPMTEGVHPVLGSREAHLSEALLEPRDVFGLL